MITRAQPLTERSQRLQNGAPSAPKRPRSSGHRRQAERAVSAGRLTNDQMRTLLQHYEESLRSYTYLTAE